ncbi:site-specific integrase [Streptomyces sp. 21So2-11]|uniref:site-specific integrase n=1 Tax=Streptomyces sp. 21So2-11 TaxID=3144408 RepID=UPI003219DF22
MTSATSATPVPDTVSPFAGADVFKEAGWTSLAGFIPPRFGDDVWDLTGIRGRPQHLWASQLIWDFTEIVHPGWRLVAKELILAQWAPTHPAVAQLPMAYRTPRALATASRLRPVLFDWLNWLTQQGIASLGEVTQDHCQRHLLVRSTIRDRHGRPLREASVSHKRMVVTAIMDLAFYSDLFTSDRYAPELRPWGFAKPSLVAGLQRGTKENKTPPVPDRILQPLLGACLYIVDVLGPQAIDLRRQLAARPPRARDRERKRPTVADLSRVLTDHHSTGEPLVELVENHVARRLGEGWHPHDPLLRVSFQALSDRAGCGEYRSHQLTAELRRTAEETAAAVGLAKPWGRKAPAVTRSDSPETVPWTEPLHIREFMDLVVMVRLAALTVIATLSGMRYSELAELAVGCRRTIEVAPGLIRRSLNSKIIKGQPLGGVEDEWIVLDEVHRAVALIEALHDHPVPGAPLLGRMQYSSNYTSSLHPWINSPAGLRLGLAPVPDGPVNLRMLRRTLAMELGYRPHGMLAAKIALKHVSAVTTEGYTARPGGSQAKLLAEAHEHERERNLSLVLAEFRNYQQGVMPSGPGARDLIDFFAHVDGELAQTPGSPPHIRSSDQDLRNLLAKRAGILHLGSANFCWFADPSKALCLKLAGTPNADKPLAGMCDSARCPQATHHACHRPVWAGTAVQTKVFLGSLSRRQNGERSRLQAELDRAERVLHEIDNAVGIGPREESNADQ